MKQCLFFLFAIIVPRLSNAQIENTPVEPSDAPFVDYSKTLTSPESDLFRVNTFTGVGSVTIPFYKYAIPGADLSVSINYDIKGIQVDGIPSSVGIGWELYAGGYIERQYRGSKFDEMNYTLSLGSITARGCGFWPSVPVTDRAKGDDEADIFSASFGGKNIEFMFSKTGELITIPQNFNNYRIKRYINGVLAEPQTVLSNGDLSFEISDDQGNTFYFDKQRWITRESADFLPTGTVLDPSPLYRISKWKLQKVVTCEGQVIKYFYDFDNYYDGTYPGQNELSYIRQSVVEKTGAQLNVVYENDNYFKYHLSKIEYPNNIDVVFHYASESNNLNSIDVKERSASLGAHIQQYTYLVNRQTFHSPFNTLINSTYYLSHPLSIGVADDGMLGAPAGRQTLARNALKSIDLVGLDGVTTKKLYSFQYKEIPLPERYYGGRDIYGYSNGQLPVDNSTVGPSFVGHLVYVPQHTFGSFTIGMDRNVSPDVNIVAAESLTGITNEFGGKISWNYQVNPLIVGGLLITDVNKYDGYSHENDVNVSYAYSDGEHFVAEGPATYVFKQSDCITQTIWLNSGNLLNPTLDGTNYGFKTVSEITKDNLMNQVQKHVYYYNGIDPSTSLTGITGVSTNLLTNGIPFGQIPYSNKQYLCKWGKGLLWKKETYDYHNEINKTESFTYHISCVENSSANFTGLKRFFSNACHDDFGAVNIIEDSYQPFTGYTVLTGKTTRNWYNSTNFIENKEVFYYTGDQRLAAHYYYNSLKNTIYELYYYSNDWDIPGIPYPGNAVHSMNINGINKLLAIYKYKNLSTDPLTAAINDPTNNLENLSVAGWIEVGGSTKIYRPKYKYSFLTPTTPVSYLSSGGNVSYVNSANLSLGHSVPYGLLQSTTTVFDDVGNSLEETDKSQSNFDSKIIDGEKNNVLAEAQNAKYGEIAYCGFESDYRWPSPSALSYYMSGNWNFNPDAISTAHSLLGRCSFHCSDVAGTTLNTATPAGVAGLIVGKQYTVSYWVLGTGAVFVNDGSSTTISTSAEATYTVPGTTETWTLYKGTFAAAASGIGMWGEGYVDEIKLRPSDCIMLTYNYLPLVGKIANVDANDNITLFEHDAFGNITVVRDQNGNIVSKTKTASQEH